MKHHSFGFTSFFELSHPSDAPWQHFATSRRSVITQGLWILPCNNGFSVPVLRYRTGCKSGGYMVWQRGYSYRRTIWPAFLCSGEAFVWCWSVVSHYNVISYPYNICLNIATEARPCCATSVTPLIEILVLCFGVLQWRHAVFLSEGVPAIYCSYITPTDDSRNPGKDVLFDNDETMQFWESSRSLELTSCSNWSLYSSFFFFFVWFGSG